MMTDTALSDSLLLPVHHVRQHNRTELYLRYQVADNLIEIPAALRIRNLR